MDRHILSKNGYGGWIGYDWQTSIHSVKKDGSFSVSGAHSKGTGVLQENGQDKYFLRDTK
jgi:hypothetical protein